MRAAVLFLALAMLVERDALDAIFGLHAIRTLATIRLALAVLVSFASRALAVQVEVVCAGRGVLTATGGAIVGLLALALAFLAVPSVPICALTLVAVRSEPPTTWAFAPVAAPPPGAVTELVHRHSGKARFAILASGPGRAFATLVLLDAGGLGLVPLVARATFAVVFLPRAIHLVLRHTIEAVLAEVRCVAFALAIQALRVAIRAHARCSLLVPLKGVLEAQVLGKSSSSAQSSVFTELLGHSLHLG
eukprot:CAMPEP_0202077688 /NCGR_PEP_ID=MMETSP0964-20121228/5514_1 /ASSEMBLY_ACC=CAM_ASM_000500 /TAXON_ID=4773 /ORGANISM="Schizochytrium aggregatum, Strain ATCC28209" /LENGTH=247 /DNA_ID=CAMNT_0048644971 /DNA_START=217 /DNA_END=957 /DNA_ORIENTATION=+